MDEEKGDTSKTPRGQVFWIRHGESKANEKNIFAGIVDFSLTSYGELQGRRAAEDLQKKFGSKGGVFDIVFTSNLHRAIQTKELALKQERSTNHTSSQDDNSISNKPSSKSTMINDATEHIVATEIGERSQGIFTGENKAMIMSLFGVTAFEEFLTDASHRPLGGESGGDIYDRCSAFYTTQVQPRTERGENVLIVCHEFVMMGMAAYLDGRSRRGFRHFKVPNGKTLSNNDLVDLLNSETDKFNERLKLIRDWTTVLALEGAVLLYILGALLRIVSGSQNGLPPALFKTIIVVLNVVSSLYTYLDVNLWSTCQNVSWVAVLAVGGMFAIRWAVAIPAISSVEGAGIRNEWMLWLLIPSAMTAPASTRLIGGNMYEAATISPALNICLPLLIFLLVEFTSVFPESLVSRDSLTFFWAILAGGLWMPCALSQFCRWKNPVETAKHTERWKFLTGWALMGLGFFGGFQTCPPDGFRYLRDLNSSNEIDVEEHNVSPLTWALGLWLTLRYSAMALTMILHKTLPHNLIDHRQLVDIFVLLTSPNFFLWLSLREDFNSFTTFWAGLFFFGGIAFEHHLEVHKLGQRLCKTSIGGTMMSHEHIDELVESFDLNGDGLLCENEFAQLFEHFYRNSGENVPDEKLMLKLKRKMMLQLGQTNDGVPLDAVKSHLREYGCYANFNTDLSRHVDSSLTPEAVKLSLDPSISSTDFVRNHRRSLKLYHSLERSLRASACNIMPHLLQNEEEGSCNVAKPPSLQSSETTSVTTET